MKLRSKVGISALVLLFAALPVMACAVPGGFQPECCKKMAEHCGQAGMADSHPCCQKTATSADFLALKVSSSSSANFSPVVFHGLPISTVARTHFSSVRLAFQGTYTHSPPELRSLSTIVLRI